MPEDDAEAEGRRRAARSPHIDGYVIERSLGDGGGGAVYLARRELSDRRLAIKVFHHRLDHERAMRRIWREIELLEEIRLDAVPRIIDHGVADGRLYVVTEYIDGLPVDAYCERHGLDVRARVEFLAEICDAVQRLHDYGVMHRDLKPGNILIDEHGKPAIIDFGIAAFLAPDRHVTITADDAPIGSPAYMSPEQARGERSRVTMQSDVYSLGATAYRVLLGETPHAYNDSTTQMEMLHRAGCDEPRRPREIDPRFPKPLSEVLARATAREPEERYRSASEFADDLRRWLRREPVEAGRAGVFDRVARCLRRHPATCTTVLCLAIAALVIAGTLASVWWLHGKPYDVILTEDTQEAHLIALDGRILRTWRADQKYGIKGAEWVPGDLTGGRGPMVVISWADNSHPDDAAPFEVYCVNQGVEQPAWADKVEQSDLPAEFVRDAFFAEGTGAHWVYIADIFDEVDGAEIVTVFQHERAACSMRVYGWDGSILFEVWHDGNIHEPLWLEESGRLIVEALNAEAYWAERDYPEFDVGLHPKVLFAITPRITGPSKQIIKTSSTWGTFEPEWYQCLLPVQGDVDRYAGASLTPDFASAPDADFAVNIEIKSDTGDRVAFAIPFDADGREVEGRRANGQYMAAMARGEVPEFNIFKYGPLPPTTNPNEDPGDGTGPRRVDEQGDEHP